VNDSFFGKEHVYNGYLEAAKLIQKVYRSYTARQKDLQ